jgi:hypothetical protein
MLYATAEVEDKSKVYMTKLSASLCMLTFNNFVQGEQKIQRKNKTTN